MLIDNKDGVVMDTETVLTWQQGAVSKKYTWEGALKYCQNLSLAGYSDWRLPTIKELRTIVDKSRFALAINIDYFPDTWPSSYWSSTTHTYCADYAWGMYFYLGYDRKYYKSRCLYVRAVRGGEE